MRVLVSGAHGLVGGALRTALVATGHLVVPLERARPADVADGSVAWEPAAGRIDGHRLQALGPYDAVVHLAGAPLVAGRWTRRRRAAIATSRIGSTRTLVAALDGLDPVPPVMVCASAVGFYGDRGDEELTEASPAGTGFLAGLCQEWEAAALGASGRTRVVRLRSGIVLSTRGGALARQLPLFRLGLGGRLGSGRQYLPWITITDEVGVIRRAIEDPTLEGPVNAVAPGTRTNAELTAALGKALRRPAVMAVPRAVLAVSLGAELADEMLLASQRVQPGALVAAGFHYTDPDLEPALRRLVAAGA